MRQRLSFSRRRLLALTVGLAGLTSFALSTAMPAHAEAIKTVKVGIMSGEDEDVWRVVAKNAATDGLNVKITTFSDYNAPNEALIEHDLDANAFQHTPYLEAQNKAHGYHLVIAGNTTFQPIGFYSRKWKSLADIPKNAKIGVPNDPSNEGRALLMLQSLGLIKVSSDAGLFPTALDVTDNPHNITIEELDAGVVGRSLPDLDGAVINTDWARKAGVDLKKERLGTENLKDNPYVNIIVVNQGDEDKPWAKSLVKAFQQPNVAKALHEVYHGTVLPAWP
ncbi:metal ABC transporter substrate-binding protein [Aristophania vespae]|uniref:Lipoprotein n=1 Tax=Aristophania vespae TaxID=2697033 RepID=A0A6P1NHS9_9PROT|nr:MetQ/NlpA family ABC transporter substrate-binding protein [Aristophania vespae]QHI96090.1 metal ABC transporter substrate-binding protein [Aristophania vespae]UMM63857.1 D-methionine-binding lipoprotein MetQ [Aristophania vespae]